MKLKRKPIEEIGICERFEDAPHFLAAIPCGRCVTVLRTDKVAVREGATVGSLGREEIANPVFHLRRPWYHDGHDHPGRIIFVGPFLDDIIELAMQRIRSDARLDQIHHHSAFDSS